MGGRNVPPNDHIVPVKPDPPLEPRWRFSVARRCLSRELRKQEELFSTPSDCCVTTCSANQRARVTDQTVPELHLYYRKGKRITRSRKFTKQGCTPVQITTQLQKYYRNGKRKQEIRHPERLRRCHDDFVVGSTLEMRIENT